MNYHVMHRPPNQTDVDRQEAALICDLFVVAPENYLRHILRYETVPDGLTANDVFALARTIEYRIHGNPETLVQIYRGTPKPELNTGDWVSLSRKYANIYANGNAYDDGGAKLYTATVKAKHLVWGGDSLFEFGYLGEPVEMTEVI